MTVRDQLTSLAVMFDVHVALTLDGEHLRVTGGNSEAVGCATPRLMQIKPEIVGYLREATRRVAASDVRGVCP